MKQLKLAFHSQAGKTKTLVVDYVDQSLTTAQAQQTLEEIAALDLFADDTGSALYAQPVSAAYVERTTTPLYQAPSVNPVAVN